MTGLRNIPLSDRPKILTVTGHIISAIVDFIEKCYRVARIQLPSLLGRTSVLKFLSKQPVFLGYFDRLFSSVCLNKDTQNGSSSTVYDNELSTFNLETSIFLKCISLYFSSSPARH